MDLLGYWKTCIKSYVLSDEESASEDNSQISVSTTQKSQWINGFTSVTDELESSIDELECNVSVRLNSHSCCHENETDVYLYQMGRQNSKINGCTTNKFEEYHIINFKQNLTPDINPPKFVRRSLQKKQHDRKYVSRKDTRLSPVSRQSVGNYMHLDLQTIKETWFDFMDDSSDSSDDEAFQRYKPKCADTYCHVNNRPEDNQKRRNVELTHSGVKFRNPSFSSTGEESSGFYEDYSEITSSQRRAVLKPGTSSDSAISESNDEEYDINIGSLGNQRHSKHSELLYPKIGFDSNRFGLDRMSDGNHEQPFINVRAETFENSNGRQSIFVKPSTGFGYNKWYRPDCLTLLRPILVVL